MNMSLVMRILLGEILSLEDSKSRNLCGRLPEGDGREAGDRCSI